MNIFSTGMSAVSNVAFTLPNIISDVREARHQGKSAAWAATASAVKNNWMNVLMMGASAAQRGMFALQALQAMPMLAGMAYGYAQTRVTDLRIASTPFSHRFEHSDNSWQAQQRGMQAITGARTLIGSEAGAMSRRYGRH